MTEQKKIELEAIVAVDAEWAIGKDNRMLFSIPEDMKFFVATTLGAVVISGRKNLESFPGGKPLTKRRNIILSTTLKPGLDYEVCRNRKEVFHLLETVVNQRIFIIGGSQVYEEYLPYCSRAYVTKMDKVFHGEKFFPNLDQDPNWKVVHQSEEKVYQDVKFQFLCYENENAKAYPCDEQIKIK